MIASVPQRSLLAAALAASLAACTATVAPPEGEAGAADEAIVVPPGKADDFYSADAQEYRIEGTTTVTLEAEYAGRPESERLARVKELIPLRQIVIGWFLSQYVKPKDTDPKHGDPNKNYGGFAALTKNGSYEDLRIRQLSGETYAFTLRQEIGGRLDLLSVLPTRVGADGKRRFDLAVGKISNEDMARLEINHEWYREAPWENFDPAQVAADRWEMLELVIEPQPRTPDAWIDTKRLFADGKVEIGLHFGWDYHEQYHLKHSRETYEWLVRNGWKSPVSSFDAYQHDSPPLTKTIQADGRAVDASVYLRWGKPGTATDPDTDAGGRLLEELLRGDLATKEVVAFSGHSGPFYGFALANWKKTEEGDLDDAEIPDLPLLDGYQVVLAEGCNTYALGQAFWDNPAKHGHRNLDIITTTSFSNASTSEPLWKLIGAIVGTDDRGNHVATRYGTLIERLGYEAAWFETMYGVHGVDDNPHLHPYAEVDDLCAPCSTAADCGGAGNVCARLPDDGGKVCTAECTADDGCPDGYLCTDLAVGRTLTTRACVPKTFSCEGSAGPTRERVTLNEIGASPASGLAGDWNRDGVRSSANDEFVEIVNPGTVTVRLGGWTVSDGSGIRFTFPTGTELPPRGVALVFGGGTPPARAFDGARVFVAREGLGLNDAGDVVILKDGRGSQIDRVSYGSEGGRGLSLVREVEGDTESDLNVHPEPVTASPGLRAEGGAF